MANSEILDRLDAAIERVKSRRDWLETNVVAKVDLVKEIAALEAIAGEIRAVVSDVESVVEPTPANPEIIPLPESPDANGDVLTEPGDGIEKTPVVEVTPESSDTADADPPVARSWG